MGKTLLCLFMILLSASQLFAETYSWVDNTGTWNFSEDYYSVPKKYRKNIKRFGDVVPTETPQNSAPAEKITGATEISQKGDTTAGGNKQLYAGKTQEAWRKEFDVQEAELKRLELQLEQLRVAINEPDQASRLRRSEMLKEYEAVRVEYKDKYKTYSELMESARKAGLIVEIKK